jgi:predicted PolB exonuclease-like 3'-5' exonuclease
MEMLSDYRAAPQHGLDEIATAIGLPGKIGGHGSEVEAMVTEGRLGQVRAYCESDVLNPFGVYIRWALLAGKTDASGHTSRSRGRRG